MVKVPKPNKFQNGRNFFGDDEEPQDFMAREDSIVENSENKAPPTEKDKEEVKTAGGPEPSASAVADG